MNKLTVLLVCVLMSFPLIAQEQKNKPVISNKGIKAALGTGSFKMISERNIQEGEGASLNIGYGFTDRFSLWLNLLGSEHRMKIDNSEYDFGGLEINLQHKFTTGSRLQPYGKVGVGVYGLEEKDSSVSLIGTGINLGVGVDYFFSKHFGIGAELMIKKLDYTKERTRAVHGDIIKDIRPNLNGDSSSFMLTFTIQ